MAAIENIGGVMLIFSIGAALALVSAPRLLIRRSLVRAQVEEPIKSRGYVERRSPFAFGILDEYWTDSNIQYLLLLLIAACGGGGSDAPAAPACVPQRVQVVLLGNSIMAGIGDDPTLRAMLAAQFGPDAVTVANRAIGGTELGDIIVGRAGFAAWPQGAGDVTVILDGTNEARRGTPLASFRTDLETVAARPLVVLITPPPLDATQPLSNGADTAPYAQAVRDVAAAHLIVPADAFAYTAALPAWQALLRDGVHPTDEFYAQLSRDVVAPAVIRAVAPLRCVAP